MRYKLCYYATAKKYPEDENKDIIFDLPKGALPLDFRIIPLPESKIVQCCLDYLVPIKKKEKVNEQSL